MSLQQVDLCECTSEAACQGPVQRACAAVKQVGLLLWEMIVLSKFSITFASRMRPPSDMLSAPAADLTVEEFVAGLRSWHSIAELKSASPTHFQFIMNVCVNMKESVLELCCCNMKEQTSLSDVQGCTNGTICSTQHCKFKAFTWRWLLFTTVSEATTVVRRWFDK